MRRKRLVVPAALGVLVFVGASCGGSEPSPEPAAQEPMGEHMNGHMGGTSAAVDVPANALEVRVTASEFSLTPATVRVGAGKPVALTLVNDGEVLHDWTARESSGASILGAHAVAEPGEEATAVFKLDAGTYKVSCTEPGHEDAGMTGEIVAS